MSDRAHPSISRHVKELYKADDRLPDLVAAGEAVERLQGSDGWLALNAVIDREVATIDRELDHGRPKEAAEYAYAHGRRSALLAPREAARAILEHAQARAQRAIEAEAATAEAGR